MNIDKLILRQSLLDLPGWEGQKQMAPGENPLYRKVPKDHKLAAVMALLYTLEEESHIILIERAHGNVQDKHAGQLGFPGGKFEEDDSDMLQCALREVEEEIGVSPKDIFVVGPLSPLYVFASNFHVFPYIGLLSSKPQFTIQTSEVHKVITVPLATIMSNENKATKNISVGEHVIKDVPYYDIEGKALWGATAMIMSELESALKPIINGNT